jgi:hypothetical protein
MPVVANFQEKTEGIADFVIPNKQQVTFSLELPVLKQAGAA